MAQRGQPERCVFCGNPIGPDEPAVGHGESAAHASCADAGLGDERLWDGIAIAVGDGAPAQADDGSASPGGQGPPAAGRTGCVMLAALLLAVASMTWRICG